MYIRLLLMNIAVIDTSHEQITAILQNVPNIRLLKLKINTPDYEEELFNFYAIRNSDCVVVNSVITQQIGLLILFAMKIGKAVVMCSTPQYDSQCLLRIREDIQSNLSKIIVGDLTQLDDIDRKGLIQNVATRPKTSFSLAKHRKSMISYSIRAHLRDLLAASI